MLQTCTSLLPFLVSSNNIFHRYQTGKDCTALVSEWAYLDSILSATMTSHVSRRASTAQGSGMLRAYIKTFPCISQPLQQIKKTVLRATIASRDNFSSFGVCGHAVTCFGAVCGLLGIDIKTSCTMFLYTNTRDMINAAVRMNLTGPLEAGGMINNICAQLEKLILDMSLTTIVGGYENIQHTFDFDLCSIHQISPLLEILSNAHDRLYTRLFNS